MVSSDSPGGEQVLKWVFIFWAGILAALELIHFYVLGASWQFCVGEGLILLAIGALALLLLRRTLAATPGAKREVTTSAGESREWYSTNEMKSHEIDLLSVIAHEMRSPLTTMRGLAHLIAKNWDQLSEEKRKWALESLASEVNRASTMLEEISMAAEIISGDLETNPTQTNLQDSARRAIDRFDDRRVARLELDLPAEPFLAHVDPFHLEWILVQLLDNALRFSPEETTVELIMKMTDEGYSIAVRDRGPGFTEEERSRLFEMFSKSNIPEKREKEGPGLGLYLARELARTQGASLDLERGSSEGTTFVLVLQASSLSSSFHKYGNVPRASKRRSGKARD